MALPFWDWVVGRCWKGPEGSVSESLQSLRLLAESLRLSSRLLVGIYRKERKILLEAGEKGPLLCDRGKFGHTFV